MKTQLKVNLVVVTYNRLLKFLRILMNLRQVAEVTNPEVDLIIMIIEDTKTSDFKSFIKRKLTSIILDGYSYSYQRGANNLGESRDIAMMESHEMVTDWIGYIDDDDYYNPQVLNILEPAMRYSADEKCSIINFGMSGNLVESSLYREVEPRNRLKFWNDKNELGVVPSMACLINVNSWVSRGYKFGRNFPSEETSVLMAFTYSSDKAFQVSKNLMFRNRAKDSLVNNLNKYPKAIIANNIETHVKNLRKYLPNYTQFIKVYEIFKFNYGSYLESHGAPDSKDAFINIENNKFRI